MFSYKTEADLSSVRERLLRYLDQRPAPVAVIDARGELRRARLAHARLILRRFLQTTAVAAAIGVTTRAVRYWRANQYAPTARHYGQLRALARLVP
jgi:hypothetical protein